MESNRLTVIVDGGIVVRDSGTQFVDLSSCGIPDDIHALQWNNGSGEIEYRDTRHNLKITELPNWATPVIAVWEQLYATQLEAEQSYTTPE